MNIIFVSALVLAFIVFAGLSVLAAAAMNFGSFGVMHALTGKSIDVAIYDGSNRSDRSLPAIKGGAGAFSGGYGFSINGQQTHVQVDETYKVVTDERGHLRVNLHRVLDQNGLKVTSDRTLPVWDKEPAAGQRIKLDDGSTVAAYFGTNSH